MAHKREILATQPCAVMTQYEDADLNYTVNWAGRIGTDTISSDTWVNENGSGLTISNETTTDTTSSARITGGKGRYKLTNTIVSTSGETMQQQFDLIIKYNASGVISDYQGYGNRI